MSQEARVLVAVAAEGEDEFIWSRLKVVLPELFATGPIAFRVGFFGAEGARSTRPFLVSRWTTDADELANLLSKAQVRCVCGCFVEVGSVLAQALREARQGTLQAVVIIGDRAPGDFDAAMATAKQLRKAGTRLFLFQQGRDDSTERTFKVLAEVTGGAYFSLNPYIERIADRLPGMLEAVTQFAIGGMAALEAHGDEAAVLLLEQMNATSQIAR